MSIPRQILPALSLVAAACGDVWLPETHDQASPVEQLVVGDRHSCAINQIGIVYCWGNDAEGAVSGTPTSNRVAVPTEVILDPLVPIGYARGANSALSAGGDRSCARNVDDDLLCWGAGFEGPQRIPGGDRFAVVESGTFSCGLRANGTIACWDALGSAVIETPGTGYVALSVGGSACALGADSLPVCWTAPGATPTAVSQAPRLKQMAVGGAHACGVTAAGTAYCWGANDRGQLGDSTIVSRSEAAPIVAGELTPPLQLQQVTAGAVHTCGIMSNGSGICWGVADSGRMGIGDVQPAIGAVFPYPRRVFGNFLFVSLDAGTSHTCGTTDRGVLLCWGSNSHGQLGRSRVFFIQAYFPLVLPWPPS